MALDLFLKGSNRPVIRGTLKDISDALWEVQESINAGSFGIDAASVTFDPTSTDMSATDVDAAIKANWTDIRNIDIDGNTRTILIRADTAANLASADAVLAEFELVYESDTGLSKLGDGATAYTLLPYINTGSLQHGDVFPEPGLVESVAGAFVLDWDTDFGGPRLVKLVRAAGDVSESLLVALPEIPSGNWATVLVTEPMTFVAPNRTFALAASWTDTLGVGTVTITESGVTTATLGLAAGDVVSGGPFGSPTTISEIVSAAVFKTVAAAGETDSGTVSIVAPAYTIDGNRQIHSPTLGNAGAVMQFTVISEHTATTRGEIISAERPGGVGVVSTVVETVEATPTVVNDVMLITDAHLATKMTVTEGEVTLTETFVKLVNSDPSTAMQVRLAFGTASSTGRVVLLCDPSQTGEVTIVSADDGEDPAGTVDGVAAIVAPSSGAVLVRRKLGETKNYVTSVDDTPIFRGVVTLQGGVRETATPASATGAVEIDLAGGGIRILTMTGNVTALTFANRPPDGEAATISVYWTQDGSGSHTLAAPSGVRYPGGTAPTLVTTAAAVNLVTYIVHGQSGAVDLLAQPGMAAP